jgi:hypothetical protein
MLRGKKKNETKNMTNPVSYNILAGAFDVMKTPRAWVGCQRS